jgi:hypothetical protein
VTHLTFDEGRECLSRTAVAIELGPPARELPEACCPVMRVLQRSNDRPQRFLGWHFVRCPRSIPSPLPTPHGTGSLPYCAPYSSISQPALVKLQRPLRHASRSRMRLAAASPRSSFQSVHDRIRASVFGSFVARSVLGPDPRPPALTLARDGMLQGASALDVGVVS